MDQYLWAKDMALDMLKKYGAKVSVSLLAPSGPSSYGDAVEQIPYVEECSGLFTRYDSRMVDGTLILETDRRVLVAAKELPEYIDRARGTVQLQSSQQIWQIIRAQTIAPADGAILYMFQVRI